MLAIVVGDVTLFFGLSVLMLPLLLTELSRPRDAVWGSLILLLALGLITCHDRFNGTLLIVLISGSLLISRLVVEVGQSRWQQLSEDEKNRFASFERWKTGIRQFGETIAQFVMILSGWMKIVRPIASEKTKKKKWVRPEKKLKTQPSNQVPIDFDKQSKSSSSDFEQQPQETLERQSPLKDS